MRIAFLCNEYPPCRHVGGIGVFTHTMAHGLADAGHEVMVLGYGGASGERDDDGVRVTILPESNVRHCAWLINRRRLHAWLEREARAGRIDIVETPEYQGMLPFGFSRCPVAVRLHGGMTTFAWCAGQATRWIDRRLERRTLSLHRNWIPVSRHILEATQQCFGLSPLEYRVIYNPLRTGDRMGVEPPMDVPASYVLFVGTVSDRKGAFILAEAARTFLVQHPNVHLLYVGDLTVENGQRADARIRALVGPNLTSRVHCMGAVAYDQVLAVMRRARLLAFPSKQESFGLVCVEAMACGIPVVYSARHSGPELVDDGVTGLLANPDRPEDVAEKVLRLLNDPTHAARLAENGRQTVHERFSLAKCMDETLAFYEHLLSRRKSTSLRASLPRAFAQTPPHEPYEVFRPLMKSFGATGSAKHFYWHVNHALHAAESQVYDERHATMYQEAGGGVWERLLSHLPPVPPKLRVLDIGCGTGLVGHFLALYAPQRIGRLAMMDPCEAMIVRARKKAVDWPFDTSFACCEVEAFQAAEPFDLITTNSVLHHVVELEPFLRRVQELLAPGGLLLTSQDPRAVAVTQSDPVLASRRLKKHVPRWHVRSRIHASPLAGPAWRRFARSTRRLLHLEGDMTPLAREANRALLEAGVIARPMDENSLYKVTDVHVPLPNKEGGAGIDPRQLGQWMPDMQLVAMYTYRFHDADFAQLDAEQKERELAWWRAKDPHGATMALVFRKNR